MRSPEHVRFVGRHPNSGSLALVLFAGMLRTTLHIGIDRDDEIEDVFDRVF